MQHVNKNAEGVEVKTDVDVLTDVDCITMDDGDLRSGVKKMIDDRIGEVIDGAPEQLDTLKEIATELEKNQSGVSTILKAINSKLEAKDLKDYAKTTEVDDKLESKVSVVNGKELSTNDFTDVDKRKLDAIENGAEKNKVTSVNGMTGDVVIEAGNVGTSGINIAMPNKKTLVLTQKEYDLLENKDENTEYNIRTSDIRVLCITNHFFAGLDTDKTDVEPYFTKDIPNITKGIDEYVNSKANASVIGTLVVPDNTFENQYKDMIESLIMNVIQNEKPDIIICGPAFNAGKFAKNCCKICLLILEKFGLPAVTSIYPENEYYKKYKGLIYMIDGGNSAAKMKYDMPALCDYALHVLQYAFDKNSYLIKIGELANRIISFPDIADFKRCIVLSEKNCAALSEAEKNRADTLYFLK